MTPYDAFDAIFFGNIPL